MRSFNFPYRMNYVIFMEKSRSWSYTISILRLIQVSVTVLVLKILKFQSRDSKVLSLRLILVLETKEVIISILVSRVLTHSCRLLIQYHCLLPPATFSLFSSVSTFSLQWRSTQITLFIYLRLETTNSFGKAQTNKSFIPCQKQTDLDSEYECDGGAILIFGPYCSFLRFLFY